MLTAISVPANDARQYLFPEIYCRASSQGRLSVLHIMTLL